MKQHKLLLIGCGRMGSALLTGLSKSLGDNAPVITVIDPAVTSLPSSIPVYKTISELPEGFRADVIIIAVKPKDVEVVAKEASEHLGNNSLVISIAAGKTIRSIEKNLPPGSAVVRVMPNLPATIGMGITVGCKNSSTTPEHEKIAAQLLSAVGEFCWVDSEELINPATALSGSGPAYVFLFAECMIAAGARLGLGLELATKLTLQTFCGAAELAKMSDNSLEELRKQVTSPGGTTAAGLSELLHNGNLVKLLEAAVSAANSRAKELEES